MVTIRCKTIVKAELENLNISYSSIELGEIKLQNITSIQKESLRNNLLNHGLIIIDDKKSALIERIKTIIIEMIHYDDDGPQLNNSEFISEKLNYDYQYLSTLFSEVEGVTIEHFIILHKIEKVKELLVYEELSLTKIAEKLHYCSVSHLSTQFKKITGFSTSYFKKMKDKKRIPLDELSNLNKQKE